MDSRARAPEAASHDSASVAHPEAGSAAECPGGSAVLGAADPEAVEFVRFCRARRRVGWPELYDEMWAVASRGLFRGYGFTDFEEHGIWFSLFGTRDLAALAAAVIEAERAAGGSAAERRGRARSMAVAAR